MPLVSADLSRLPPEFFKQAQKDYRAYLKKKGGRAKTERKSGNEIK